MSILVCGDLHGKIDIGKELLQDSTQEIIFVGDILDSFEENIVEQIDLLDMIIDAANDRDNVQVLMGNHELSYLDPEYRASGWNKATAALVHSRTIMLNSTLKIFAQAGEFLITHAGVSRNWLPKGKKVPDYFQECTIHELAMIGYARGGCRYPVGGPLWCDTTEFYPIEGVKQIFGHNAYRRHGQPVGCFELFPDNWNIDCLDRVNEILEVSGGQAWIRQI